MAISELPAGGSNQVIGITSANPGRNRSNSDSDIHRATHRYIPTNVPPARSQTPSTSSSSSSLSVSASSSPMKPTSSSTSSKKERSISSHLKDSPYLDLTDTVPASTSSSWKPPHQYEKPSGSGASGTVYEGNLKTIHAIHEGASSHHLKVPSPFISRGRSNSADYSRDLERFNSNLNPPHSATDDPSAKKRSDSDRKLREWTNFVQAHPPGYNTLESASRRLSALTEATDGEEDARPTQPPSSGRSSVKLEEEDGDFFNALNGSLSPISDLNGPNASVDSLSVSGDEGEGEGEV